MSRLVRELAQSVELRIRSYARTLRDGSAELRSVFHGPPMPFLQDVLNVLSERGGVEIELQNGDVVICPVLLPLDNAAGGLAVGASGVCSRAHLVSLRNTPNGKRWVALMAPGSHDAKSVTGATDEFGISAVNNGGTATVTEWLHDAFISGLVDRAVDRLSLASEQERKAARGLAEGAIHAAAEADHHDPARPRAWAVLSRLFSVGGTDESVQRQWSRACGVAYTSSGPLEQDLQQGVLDGIVEYIEVHGFGACEARLRESASETEQGAIEAMVGHLRSGAATQLALKHAPQYFFAPDVGPVVCPAPEWWDVLTADRLHELIGNEEPRPETLGIEVLNRLVSPTAGLPVVVRAAPELRVSLPAGVSGPVDAEVTREAGRGNTAQWLRRVPDPEPLVDGDAPLHATPIRYLAVAEGYKKAAARVVVLDRFLPGVVLTARTATKVSLPKKTKDSSVFECQIVLGGEGRHFLEAHVATGCRLGDRLVGEDATTVNAESLIGAVAAPPDDSPGPWGLELFATSECQYELQVTGPNGEYTLRLLVSCGDAAAEGCRSEFERLIRLNRAGASAKATFEVQIDRQVRITDLQSWALEDPEASFHPIVIAPDCQSAWRKPTWASLTGTVLSQGQFIHDPRPRPDEYRPPVEFLRARSQLWERIRGTDAHDVIESAQLGLWMADDAVAEVVDRYVSSYREWLESDPDVASWADIVMVTSDEGDRTLSQVPFAVLVSPLHPLRFGWHALAQRTLFNSWRSSAPCPAASILNPDAVPDALSLPMRTASGGIERLLFLSAESSSDYWAVLWSATQLSTLGTRAASAPFGREFGLQVGGVASGFSTAQVGRAMDDLATLFAAKPHLNVLVASATASGEACNSGIMQWARGRFSEETAARGSIPSMGQRELQVFDERRQTARPEDAEIANLAEDTRGAVKWFEGMPKDAIPDLGIIAQLETSNPSAQQTGTSSPLGRGALLRHRVRTQLQAAQGAFISESRMGAEGPPSGDALADHVAALTARIENLADVRLGYQFAPSVRTIQSVLQEKRAEYAAVSSSSVDPACFLGGWLDGAYLWDYDLPSYSTRSGDTSGYYLLSRVRTMDSDAIRAVLEKLPGCGELLEDDLQQILLEVSRRGIPTVRGLSAGHSGASGDLGLFLAGRLLQDAFRADDRQDGLFPLIKAKDEDVEVVLSIPVDPFRGYLADLQRALGIASQQRPDILMFGISVTPSRVVMRLTPVEVKWRQQMLPVAAAKDALGQARALADLLTVLQGKSEETGTTLWKLAHQHLLISMIDFGFRVYSQREVVRRAPGLWTKLHQQVVASLLSEQAALEIDRAGRLIVFDASVNSTHLDVDGDGQADTVVVSPDDASALVRDQGRDFVRLVRGAVGDWKVLPEGVPRVPSAPNRFFERSAAPFGAAVAVRLDDSHDTIAVDSDLVTAPESHSDEPETTDVQGTADSRQDPLESGDDIRNLSADTRPQESGAVGVVPDRLESGSTDANVHGITVNVGTLVDGFKSEPQLYRPSMTSLNQLNIGVVGDLGTGKTQLIKSLVTQITRAADANAGVRPRFLIFDYKRDYQAEDFVKATGAKIVEPYQLPLNLFDTSGVMRKPEWLPRYQFFADILDKIYSNIGPVQRTNLSRAVKAAHEAASAHGRAATIYDVQTQYEIAVGGKPDSVLAILSELTIGELFTRQPEKGASFSEFFDGVVVVSLSSLGQDDRAKNLVVAIFLNLFYEFMLQLPKRPFRGADPQLRTIDSYLLVDEADNIMKYEFDVLKNILLQGREFGVGVLLASQYLRHFKAGATDYREPLLSWFVHKVPDVRPQELAALGMTANLTQLAERVKQLPMHHCLYKTADTTGAVLAGLPFYRLTQAGNGEQV